MNLVVDGISGMPVSETAEMVKSARSIHLWDCGEAAE
jgi:hypothetical protein